MVGLHWEGVWSAVEHFEVDNPPFWSIWGVLTWDFVWDFVRWKLGSGKSAPIAFLSC